MNVKVSDLMSSQVLSVKPSDSVGKIKKIFSHNNFNVLPVEKDGELVGIISQSDILNVENPFSQVHNHMTRDVLTIPDYANINLAASVMKKNKIHHLVVTENKKIIGIISSFDLLKVLSNNNFKAIHSECKNKRVA